MGKYDTLQLTGHHVSNYHKSPGSHSRCMLKSKEHKHQQAVGCFEGVAPELATTCEAKVTSCGELAAFTVCLTHLHGYTGRALHYIQPVVVAAVAVKE